MTSVMKFCNGLQGRADGTGAPDAERGRQVRRCQPHPVDGHGLCRGCTAAGDRDSERDDQCKSDTLDRDDGTPSNRTGAFGVFSDLASGDASGGATRGCSVAVKACRRPAGTDWRQPLQGAADTESNASAKTCWKLIPASWRPASWPALTGGGLARPQGCGDGGATAAGFRC
jgi:hypothetical protein